MGQIAPARIYALATTINGHPRHPLMLSYADPTALPATARDHVRQPAPWRPPPIHGGR